MSLIIKSKTDGNLIVTAKDIIITIANTIFGGVPSSSFTDTFFGGIPSSTFTDTINGGTP